MTAVETDFIPELSSGFSSDCDEKCAGFTEKVIVRVLGTEVFFHPFRIRDIENSKDLHVTVPLLGAGVDSIPTLRLWLHTGN